MQCHSMTSQHYCVVQLMSHYQATTQLLCLHTMLIFIFVMRSVNSYPIVVNVVKMDALKVSFWTICFEKSANIISIQHSVLKTII